MKKSDGSAIFNEPNLHFSHLGIHSARGEKLKGFLRLLEDPLNQGTSLFDGDCNYRFIDNWREFP